MQPIIIMNNREEIITLGHGSGAALTQQLVKELFHSEFNIPSFDDSVQLVRAEHAPALSREGYQIKPKIVVSTDAFVVNPLFFPGGDIGKLSVNGTVNDISMSGAEPAYLLASFIIEEGFKIRELEQIVHSMQVAATEVKVKIVAGDTKVVEKGKCDGLYITTTGIGYLPEDICLSTQNIQVGDKVVVNGTLGDHTIAIINARDKLGLEPAPTSDCAPLYDIVQFLLKRSNLKFVRDATRGGVATILNEVYNERGLGIIIEEAQVPYKESTVAVSEMLGLDAMYMANEGKLVAFVSEDDNNMINELRTQKYGTDAALIGKVTDEVKGVYLRTSIGSLRPLRMLASDPLPRIC